MKPKNLSELVAGARTFPSSNRIASKRNGAKELLADAKSLVIQQPKTFSVCLEIQGTADLIQNNFSQKSVEQMLRKHMGISVQREPKKPRECLEEATVYNTDKRVCISPSCFKQAMLGAASQIKTFKKTQLRTSLFVQGSSIPITFDKMIPRMDVTRTSGMNRAPDIRFRPAFQNWKARMIIEFSDMLSVQTVVDLLNRAGKGGVGEWRPQRNGTFGTFRVCRHIHEAKEIGTIEAECAAPLVPLTIPDWALDAEIDPQLISDILHGKDIEQASETE
jgi:hypothetical protein